MTSYPHQFNDIVFLIEPNQQKIALNVTFNAALVLAVQRVRLVFGRNWLLVFQHTRNFKQRSQFFG